MSNAELGDGDGMSDSTTPTESSAPYNLFAIAVSFAVLALFVALVGVAFGMRAIDESRDNAAQALTASGAAAPTMVTLSEFSIDSVVVPAGGSLHVMNTGTVAHNLTIEGTDLATSEIQPGDSDTLEVSALAPGNYTVFCSVAGHRESGMEAELQVTNGDSPAASVPDSHADMDFSVPDAGLFWYHPHFMSQISMPNGLFGTIIVGQEPLPLGRTISGGLEEIPADITIAQEIPMVLNDSGVIGYSLNGKSFPATAPIVANTGDWILVNYFNEGTQIHPMHLHQFDQIVIAEDGFPLDQPYTVDTLNVAPGNRFTVLVHLDKPGTWVWHCHILPHVEGDDGMFGMVTAIVVK